MKFKDLKPGDKFKYKNPVNNHYSWQLLEKGEILCLTSGKKLEWGWGGILEAELVLINDNGTVVDLAVIE